MPGYEEFTPSELHDELYDGALDPVEAEEMTEFFMDSKRLRSPMNSRLEEARCRNRVLGALVSEDVLLSDGRRIEMKTTVNQRTNVSA